MVKDLPGVEAKMYDIVVWGVGKTSAESERE